MISARAVKGRRLHSAPRLNKHNGRIASGWRPQFSKCRRFVKTPTVGECERRPINARMACCWSWTFFLFGHFWSLLSSFRFFCSVVEHIVLFYEFDFLLSEFYLATFTIDSLQSIFYRPYCECGRTIVKCLRFFLFGYWNWILPKQKTFLT